MIVIAVRHGRGTVYVVPSPILGQYRLIAHDGTDFDTIDRTDVGRFCAAMRKQGFTVKIENLYREDGVGDFLRCCAWPEAKYPRGRFRWLDKRAQSLETRARYFRDAQAREARLAALDEAEPYCT